MNLKDFLLENLESSQSKQELLKTPEDAYEYFFGDKKDSKEYNDIKKTIKYLYDLAYEIPQKFDSNGEPIILYPFIKNYNKAKNEHKQTFAVRRWVATNTKWMEYCSSNNIDPNKFFKNISNRKVEKNIYHNSSLQKIDKFPNSTDHEILIAMSANIKSHKQAKKDLSYEDALKYALFGDNKKLNAAEKETYEKFLKWCGDNKNYIEKLADGVNVDTSDGEPEMFCKLQTKDAIVSNDWKENKDSNKNPNKTPKADIISNKGRSISIKNGDAGAQAMSGGKDETMATLLKFKHLLDKEDQEKLNSLFKYDWDKEDSNRNSKLNSIIKQIFDKEKNPKFIISVLAESITGSNKFKGGSGAALTILTFTNDKCFEEDAETYIYRTFEHFDIKHITINHKSSKSAWAALRIKLPIHKEKYDDLKDEEKDNDLFKAMLKITNKVNKTKNSDDFEIEFEDKDKDGHPRQHRTGPKGGKYYRVNIDGSWGPWNSDQDKK